jgi:starvation-inducible outer membrane lipoprotein
MRMLLLAAAATLALAGCTTTPIDIVAGADAKVQQGLAQLCPKVAQAEDAYWLATLFVTVPADVQAKVDTARDFVDPLCADPSKVTTAEVLARARKALDDIRKAKDAA